MASSTSGAGGCMLSGAVDVLPARGRTRPPRVPRARAAVAAVLVLLPVALLTLSSPAGAAVEDITAHTGTGTAGFSGDGGEAVNAWLNQPTALAWGPDGSVFVVDNANNRIRRVAPDGVITTYAGSGSKGSAGNGGPATDAGMEQVYGVAVDAAGNLYFSQLNHNIVRRIDAVTKIVTHFAGTSANKGGFAGDGGPATSAKLDSPRGLAVTPADELLIADEGNARVRKVALATDIITTVAGTGTLGAGGDGGAATAAQLERPWGLAADATGFWITDYGNHLVRKVDTAGTITRVAGTGYNISGGDGGAATSASLAGPIAVVARRGTVFIAEHYGDRIRKVHPDGTISTLAGNGADSSTGNGGPASAATVYAPVGLALNADGDLLEAEYLGNVVRSIAAAVPPEAPVLTGSAPLSPSTSTSPAVRGSAPARTTVSLHTDASCTAPVAASGTGADLADGGIPVAVAADSTTTFWASATSIGGAVSACSTTAVTYTSDTTAPAAATLTADQSSPGTSGAPRWTFSVEPDAATSCQLTRGGLLVVDRPSCPSPATFDLTGQADGEYVLAVRATDAAGNTGTAATSAYVLDTAVPAAPTLLGSPTSPSSDTLPTWTFESDEGASLHCRLTDDTGAVIHGDAACTSPKSYDLTGQSYTPHYRLTVWAVDAAGNIGPGTTSGDHDFTAPGAGVPVLTAKPPAAGDATGVSWTFDVSDSANYPATCQLYYGVQAVASPTSCAPGIAVPYDLSASPHGDGVYAFQVTTTAGSASSTYTLDRERPADAVLGTPPPSPGRSNPVAWSFSSPDGSALECALTSGGAVPAYDPCTSPATYSLPAEGSYTFGVRAVDAAGNRSLGTVTSTYVYDVTAPVAPTIVAEQASPGRSRDVGWAFTGERTDGMQCRLSRGTTVLSPYAPCVSPVRYTLDDVDDRYTLSVTETDQAGNRGPAALAEHRLDTTAPAPPSVSRLSPAAEIGSSRTPSWSTAAEEGAALSCRLLLGATTVVEPQPCGTGYAPTLDADGVYTVVVHARDAAGNEGPATSSSYELDTSPPSTVITAGQPSPGSTRTLRWSFTTEPGATAECRVVPPGSVATGWGPCLTSYTLDPGAPDGSYAFSVRFTDAAGNVGTPVSDGYLLDGTPPAAPVLTAPTSPGTTRFPSLGISVPLGEAALCVLRRADGVALTASVACTSPWTADLTGRPDGGYLLGARAVDAAGNLGPEATASYQLLTVAVPGPSPSPSPSVSPSPSPSAGPSRSPSPSASPSRSPSPSLSPSPSASASSSPSASVSRSPSASASPSPSASPTPTASPSPSEVRAPAAQASPTAAPAAPLPPPPPPPSGPAPTPVQASPVVAPVPLGPTANSSSPAPRPSPRPDDAETTPLGRVPDEPERLPQAPEQTPAHAVPPSAPAPAPERDTTPSALGAVAGEVVAHAGEVGEVFASTAKAVLGAFSPDSLAAGAKAVTAFVRDLDAAQVAHVASVAAPKTAFPMGLVLMVGAFLAIQNRIDRNDPKLALAPVHADRHLDFTPPLSGGAR